MSLCDASEGIRNREYSAVELLEETLGRIDATEPWVHAYVHIEAEGAMARARQMDRDLAQGTYHGLLHGIPVAIKDLIHTRDMPTRAGSGALRGFRPEHDAPVVAALAGHGAVIVGKTVTHEFGYGQNPIPTRNAWDITRFPGGSSAGSAVSVAVRSAFTALGTDSGGSIRGPAAMNGVVGLKPTFGTIDRSGVFPMSQTMDQVGPITRSVADCAIVLEVLSGAPASSSLPRNDEPDANGPHVFRVGVCPSFFDCDEESRPIVDAAIARLASENVAVIEVAIPELELSVDVGRIILAADTTAWHQGMGPISSGGYHPGTRALLEFGETITAPCYVNAQRLRRYISEAVKCAFDADDLDVIVGPTLPMCAVKIEELAADILQPADGPSIADYVHHTMPANITGQPALTVPCGLSKSGLPVGLQLLGRPNEEGRLLRLGAKCEAIFGFSEPPPLCKVGKALD